MPIRCKKHPNNSQPKTCLSCSLAERENLANRIIMFSELAKQWIKDGSPREAYEYSKLAAHNANLFIAWNAHD